MLKLIQARSNAKDVSIEIRVSEPSLFQKIICFWPLYKGCIIKSFSLKNGQFHLENFRGKVIDAPFCDLSFSFFPKSSKQLRSVRIGHGKDRMTIAECGSFISDTDYDAFFGLFEGYQTKIAKFGSFLDKIVSFVKDMLEN